MKEKLTKLFIKHKIKRDSYYTKSPYKEEGNGETSTLEIKLYEHWNHRVPKGWYGISLGQPTPDSWFRFLDEFLKLVERNNPKFQILQIKLKFGSVRCYLENVNRETEECIKLVEEQLFDKHLIY